jgi:hypothetical protein
MRAGAAEPAGLSSGDRREIRRAVQHGRAVDDPALATAAVAEARRVQEEAARWTLRTPAGWPSLVGACVRAQAWILLVPALMVSVWIPDPGAIAVEIFGLVVFVHLIVRWAQNAPVLAAQSETANRALLGEDVEPPPLVPRLPWWRTRRAVRSSKPQAPAWLPIPLRQLIPLWIGWTAIVLAVGIAGPGWAQWPLPFVYLFLWVEVERRLGEPVEERLGPRAAAEARACDIVRSGRGWKHHAGFLLLLAGVIGISGLTVRSGWFHAGGVGVSFAFVLLLASVYHDLASRRRWRRRRPVSKV